MQRLILILAALTVAIPAVVAAQDSFRDVEYVSGRAGMDRKMKGTLVIDDSMITLRDKSNGASLITIPISIVSEASASEGVNSGSMGRKLLLGVFAAHEEEFVTISTVTATDAEAIVLKVKRNESLGIVAKVHFRVRKRAVPDSATVASHS